MQCQEILSTRFSSQIAKRMIGLAMSEDERIARQACMDVINHPDFKNTIANAKPDKDEEPLPIPPELASKWLSELANYRDSGNEPKEGH